jgi:hypothetical protein
MPTQFPLFTCRCQRSLAAVLLGMLLGGAHEVRAQENRLENPDSTPAAAAATNTTISYYRFQNGKWVLTEGNPPLPLSTRATTRAGNARLLMGNTPGAGALTANQPLASSAVQRGVEPILAPPTNATKTASAPPVRSTPPKPFPKIKIQGIYYRTNNPSVMINGEMLYPGGWQGKIQVVSITKTNVVLEYDGERQVFKTD